MPPDSNQTLGYRYSEPHLHQRGMLLVLGQLGHHLLRLARVQAKLLRQLLLTNRTDGVAGAPAGQQEKQQRWPHWHAGGHAPAVLSSGQHAACCADAQHSMPSAACTLSLHSPPAACAPQRSCRCRRTGAPPPPRGTAAAARRRPAATPHPRPAQVNTRLVGETGRQQRAQATHCLCSRVNA